MEMYFRLDNKLGLAKHIKRYFESRNGSKTIFNEFREKEEIETTQYYFNERDLMIVPTENDLQKFDSSLKMSECNGLRTFKKNSKIFKRWNEFVKEKGFKIVDKPMIALYIRRYMGGQSQYFVHNDVVYLMLNPRCETNVDENGFTSIKGSEFHALLEKIS